MTSLVLSQPKFMFVLATRVAGAFGIGLLVSRKLSNSRSRALGTSLLALGLLTTIPAVAFVLRSREVTTSKNPQSPKRLRT